MGCLKRCCYTFAHRRLWCMYPAGCQSIHVRAIMKKREMRQMQDAILVQQMLQPLVDDFVNRLVTID